MALHPETPAEGQTLTDLSSGRGFDVEAAQGRIAELAAQEGLPCGRRTHTYNSRLAREHGKWAEEQPGGQAIHDALFRAYFVDGVNLARIDELVRIVPERHAVIVLTAPGRDETPIGKLLAVNSYRSQVARLRVKSKIRRKAKCREREHMI